MGSRSLLFTAFLGFILASPATAWPPVDFSVSQTELERHLEEFEIRDEAANDVRAAWGRLEFNTRVALTAGEDLLEWRRFNNINLLRDRQIDSYERYWAFVRYWMNNFGRQMNESTLALCEAYFESLAQSSPRLDGISHIRARHFIDALIAFQARDSTTVDIGSLCESFWDEINDDAPIADAPIPDELGLAVRSYHLEFADLLVQRMRINDGFSRRLDEFDLADGELPRNEQAWLNGISETRASPMKIAWTIRQLNFRSANQMASLLPEPAARQFKKRALRAISPTVWAELEYEKWIDYALRSPQIDEPTKVAIRAVHQHLAREHNALAADWFALEDAALNPQTIADYYRLFDEAELIERKTGERPDINATPAMAAMGGFPQSVPDIDNLNAQAISQVKLVLGDDAAIVQAQLDADAAAAKVAEWEESRRRTDEIQSLPRWFLPMISADEFARFLTGMEPTTSDSQPILNQRYLDFVETLARERRRNEQMRDSARERGSNDGNFYNTWQGNADWAAVRTDLERRFIADIRLLLIAKDQNRWDQLVRNRRRYRTFRAAGTQLRNRDFYLVDVIEVINLSGLNDDLGPKAQAAVTEWEANVDNALLNYEERWDVTAAERAKHVADAADRDERTRVNDRYRRVLSTIRDGVLDAHMQGIDLIRASLTPDQVQRFDSAFNAAVYPWLYTKTPVDHVVEGLERDDRLGTSAPRVAEIRDHYALQRRNGQTELATLLKRFDFMDRQQTPEEDYNRFLERIWRHLLNRLELEHRTMQELAALFPADRRDDLALDTRLLLDVIGDTPR